SAFEAGDAGAVPLRRLPTFGGARAIRRGRGGWSGRGGSGRRYGRGGVAGGGVAGGGVAGGGVAGGDFGVDVDVTAPGGEEEGDEDVDTGAGEGADRATLSGRTYAVVLNDYPQAIAKKLGAFPSRAAWWAELKAVNPHKQTGPKGWKSLNAGEIINIPDEW